MFARMLSNLMSRGRTEPARPDPDHGAEAHAFLGRPIAEGPALAPPAASNDHPLAAFTEPVERELRRAGHLR